MCNNEWYLIEKNGLFFAEKLIKLPKTDIVEKILFRDFNNKVMPLGENREWAQIWINTKNLFDKLL